MFAHHVEGVTRAVTCPRARFANPYITLTTVVWKMARPTLRRGQPSHARFSRTHEARPGVCAIGVSAKLAIGRASIAREPFVSGGAASCVPCAPHSETPQSVLANITTATRLSLRGSNSCLCIARRFYALYRHTTFWQY